MEIKDYEFLACRYREANAGCFPTPSKAKAEVGGSFYTARQIIQELKHYSNLGPSAAVVKAPTRKEPRKNRKSITVSEDMRVEVRVDLESEDVAESISFGGAMTNETLRDETAADHGIVGPTAEVIAQIWWLFYLFIYLFVIYNEVAVTKSPIYRA